MLSPQAIAKCHEMIAGQFMELEAHIKQFMERPSFKKHQFKGEEEFLEKAKEFFSDASIKHMNQADFVIRQWGK